MEQAAKAIKLAREFGWPTPAWLAWGTTPSGYPYEVQEFLTRTHRDHVDIAFAKAAMHVIDIQAGKAPNIDQDWTKYDRSVVYEGQAGFYKRIAEFSDSGRDFIGFINEKMKAFQDILVQNNDLVHRDFHNGNALLMGDKITALIDAEYMGRGSRLHDITTIMVFALLFEGEAAVIDALMAYCRKHAAAGEFKICFVTNLTALLSVSTFESSTEAFENN